MKSEVLKAAFSARRPERFFEVLERYSIFQKDSIWKKYGLWPLTEEMLSGGISGEEQSGNQNRNGLSVIRGGGIKRLKRLKEQPENGHRDYELSEKKILQRVGQILDNIEVHHREWTGGRNRKYSTLKTRVIAGRLPVELINQINRLQGSKTFHLERALRLYVKVMGAKD